jgi:hypothetical protein
MRNLLNNIPALCPPPVVSCAILFTEMVGYAAAALIDERPTLALGGEQENLVRLGLVLHRGRKVESRHDGLLVGFESALVDRSGAPDDAREQTTSTQSHFRGGRRHKL